MSLLEKWKMNINLSEELLLNSSSLEQTHLEFDLETQNSILNNYCEISIPESYLQNKFLDNATNTSFSFGIGPPTSENASAEPSKNKHFRQNRKRKIKNEPKIRQITKIAKQKRLLYRMPKRKHNIMGDAVRVPQKRKLDSFPHYEDLSIDDENEMIEDQVAKRFKFVPPEDFFDFSLENDKTKQLKESLLQFVASSLIFAPSLKKSQCEISQKLEEICSEVAEVDPEFILKVALYGRQELNIRSASNFLVAFAALNEKCKKFVKKYYKHIVILPSDWIEIAEFCLYQNSYEMPFGVIPVCLRRSMVEKFTDFDTYQLAKYNKTNSKIVHTQLEDGSYPDRETRIKDKKESGEKLFTLKQLIRQLHISKPAHNVMCLLGKKYPADLQQFYKSKLDGTFDDKMAGKRMKLPVPETWETQISLHGNSAKVWQDLIDKKKLPYMAMLRNVRNLIKANISSKHEKIVLQRLSDTRNVISSRQLPTQFFSAYSVLEKMETDLEGSTDSSVVQKRRRKGPPKEITYKKCTLDSYRAALNTAIKVATIHNLEPIKGKTVIIYSLNTQSQSLCSAAKSFGRSWSVKEVGILLGLMCYYSCEQCELIIWNQEFGHFIAKVESGNILENVQKLLKTIENKANNSVKDEEQHKKNFNEYLLHKLETRERIDTLIEVEDCEADIKKYKTLYRLHVSENLLFVNISLMANRKIILPQKFNPQNRDITIKGFSVQLLNFIARCQNENQLSHVERIDITYNLKPTSSPVALAQSQNKMNTDDNSLTFPQLISPFKMKTVRVFISSTFNDMHGERNLLTRFIFPKLRKWAEKRGIHLYEVDLRWGIPKEEAKTFRNLEICLSEVSNCDLFIGILGERYGWIPSAKEIPSSPEFDWIRDHPNKNASITELEMHLGALSQPTKRNAFFFFRDNEFETDVPKHYLQYFTAENSDNYEMMYTLKQKIRNSGFEVFDGYPAEWGGITEGKAFVSGLEEFGKRVFNQIKNAVEKLFDSHNLDGATEDVHQRYVKKEAEKFIGRKLLVNTCLKMLSSLSSGVIMITGKPGFGKSALMAKLIHECVNSKITNSSNILVNLVGVAPDSTNIMSILTRFCWQMQASCNLHKPITKDYILLIKWFQELLCKCVEKSNCKIFVFIDGLDNLEDYYQPYNMAWLSKIPNNVVFVLSVQEGELYHKQLHSKKHLDEFVVRDLAPTERAEMVRRTLLVHRKKLEESVFNNQMRLLTYKTEAISPFFLELACEELRVFGVFEKVTEKLKSLPATIPSLLEKVFDRLEQEFGKDVIQVSLSLISCAINGLLSTELFELLNLHWKLKELMKAPQQNIHKMSLKEIVSEACEDYLPRSKFVRLHFVLQHFLNFANTSVMSNIIITHKLTKAAIKKRYLTSTSINYYHRLLAAFFYQKSDYTFSGLWDGEDPRSFTVLPYHLACSGSMFTLVSDVLCNLHYIYSMCKFGLVPLLLEYFSPRFLTDKKLLMGQKASQYKQFLASNQHILAKCPSLLWQQVLNAPTDMHHINLPSQQNISAVIKLQNRAESKGNHILTIDNFPQPLTCVALSEAHELVACGSEDCVIYLLDSQTGKELQRFIGHSNAISDVCFVGATYLCSASLDKTLCFWDVQNGHRISIMNGHTRKVTSCCVNQQMDLIASASLDRSARIWNPHKGEQICCFSLKWPVNCISFHPEKNQIVIGCWDSTLQIWDITSQSKIAVMRGLQSSAQAVTYSPSGKHIIATSLEGNANIWAANKGSMIGNIFDQNGCINKIVFNPHGSMMAIVGDDRKLKLWSDQLGTLIHRLQNENNTPATCITFSPQMLTFAVGYHDGNIRQFDLSTGFEISAYKLHRESITCIKYSPTKRQYLVTGYTDSTVMISHAKAMPSNVKLSDHSSSVMCVDICTKYLVSSSLDTTVCVYRLKTDFKVQPQPFILTWHDAPVTSCALHADEIILATAGRDMNIAIWDLSVFALNKDKLNPIKTLMHCHNDWITDCKWSNSCSNLVTASNDFNLKVWNMSTGKQVCELVGHTAPINSVSYSNGIVVSCSSDGSTKVWSDKGFEVTSLYGHPQRVNCCDVKVSVENDDHVKAGKSQVDKNMHITPEKQKNIFLATCGDSGLVQIWKPMKCLEIACLTGHTDDVVGLSFKKNLLATCSKDGSLRLWSPPDISSKPLITNLGDTVTGGDYDPVSHRTILSCRNGTVQLWDCKDPTNPLKMITSKLSNYSINCVQFCNGEDNRFVTGSDDKAVTIWNLISKSKSFIIRKKLQYFFEMPVHSLAYFRYLRGEVFVSASLSGQILVNYMLGGVTTIEKHTSLEPILKFSSVYHGSHIEVLAICSSLTIHNWIFTTDFLSKQYSLKIEQEGSCTLLMSELPVDVKLTAVCKTENINYVGLSNGDLFVEDVQKRSITSFKLHHGTSLEQILVLPTMILTADSAGVIKVWTPAFQQVGEFHCSAAVTCLINLSSRKEEINFMAGDLLGFVYYLSMKL